MSILTHLDAEGRARMVDVSHKALTRRRAVATGLLRCAPETLTLVREGRAPKGAVVSTAEIAGVMGAKRTADLLPLCHPLPIPHRLLAAR
jgi:cyclic pyranopterin phosphate synthase